MRMFFIEPKVPSRGYESLYKESKISAHTTINGRGKIARLTGKRRGKRTLPDSH